ncbi:MAG: 23S rRNA (uracil(1939)-C(5))-methyltransferase RlmD [Candidatus Diapherotrites archaeon]|nr:23S rRNA (uracil(1939)-C(5))-methyltransferase RlmD [Candidatus Diapherotrites archaeon]
MFALKVPENACKREPKCKHFGACGGCSYQHICYEDQLRMKKAYLEKLFERELEVIPSPKEFFYRNKIELVCAFGKIGLWKKATYKHVVDLQECCLHSKKVAEVLPELRELLKKHNIQGYNYLTHKGYLRYIVLRHAKFTGEYMVNFVTANENENICRIAQELREKFDSIIWSVNSSRADTSFANVRQFWKSPYIEERFDNITFRMGANTFFQNNSYVALQIYRKIKECVSGRVLDLYAGCATISAFVADNCNYVEAVEINSEAIDYGCTNLNINNITNVKLLQQDVYAYLKNKQSLDFDYVIVDPPRAGLEKTLKHILRLKPKNIIYISCNPVVLRRELFFFKKFYNISELLAYDMFPQTQHIELLCVLERK